MATRPPPALSDRQMHQQISADVERGNEAAEIDQQESAPQIHTALECLVKIARHHGVDLAVDRLRHTYAVAETPVSQIQLLRIAKETGFARARPA